MITRPVWADLTLIKSQRTFAVNREHIFAGWTSGVGYRARCGTVLKDPAIEHIQVDMLTDNSRSWCSRCRSWYALYGKR